MISSEPLLGEFEGGKLYYRGRVGTGFDADMLDDLGARFAKLRRTTRSGLPQSRRGIDACVPHAVQRDSAAPRPGHPRC